MRCFYLSNRIRHSHDLTIILTVRKLGYANGNTQRKMYGQFRSAKLIFNRTLVIATAKNELNKTKIILWIITKTSIATDIATEEFDLLI